VDLSLDDGLAPKALGDLPGLLGILGYLPIGGGNPVQAEEFLGLVFVDIHR
jgi:hypothetical protein